MGKKGSKQSKSKKHENLFVKNLSHFLLPSHSTVYLLKFNFKYLKIWERQVLGVFTVIFLFFSEKEEEKNEYL